MSQPNSWYQAYRKLSDFVTEHPEIDVGASRVIMPNNARPEFYRLFNNVKDVFVENNFTGLQEARSLSKEYVKVEMEVIKLLELEKISIKAHLQRFLHDPLDELIRELSDSLFDLLKGKIDIETFEARALSNMGVSFRDLYHLGYEKWVALSLITLLEADKLFHVTVRKLRFDYDRLFAGVSSAKEDVSVPIESKCLSSNHPLATTLIVPDFIVHSARLNRYFALRSEMGTPLMTAQNTIESREWYPLDSIRAFASGLTLVYLADKPEEVSLIADTEKICRPDLIIKCEENEDWHDGERMEKIKLQHNALNPILGTYIVSREPIPEQVYEKATQEEALVSTPAEKKPEQTNTKQADIHILSVGFDKLKLQPVINQLKNYHQDPDNED